jgi:hypothetical protein
MQGYQVYYWKLEHVYEWRMKSKKKKKMGSDTHQSEPTLICAPRFSSQVKCRAGMMTTDQILEGKFHFTSIAFSYSSFKLHCISLLLAYYVGRSSSRLARIFVRKQLAVKVTTFKRKLIPLNKTWFTTHKRGKCHILLVYYLKLCSLELIFSISR